MPQARWASLRLASTPQLLRSSSSASLRRLHAQTPHPSGRRRPSRFFAAPPAASWFDGAWNHNPLDYLKVPRDQAQLTLYPWIEGQYCRERMRFWLQRELCMSETQARRALGCCPALAQLDVQLVQRRLRQLERGWDLTRGEAALLGLSRPHVLLPAPADVVSYALERPLIVRPR